MGQIDNFKAVNSAIEVDLLGQVNAEMIRGRQVSGIGGALDFMRGAARSRGGASVVALPATAAGGKVSRIVATLSDGNAVTASRSDVDAVATEFGVARLRGLSVPQRAEALAEIAAPEFRGELRTAARCL
jgi:4-hydroxybutyrate CoA-transferase